MIDGVWGAGCGVMTVLLSDRSTRSNEQAENAAVAAARELGRHGVTAGERVLLLAENSPEFVIGLLALIDADASVVVVDAHQARGEIERVSRATGTGIALVDRSGAAPAGTRAIVLGELVSAAESAPGRPGRRLSPGAWAGRRDALIAWSSGSTGHPKGIVRSGAAIMTNTGQTCARMAYTGEDVLVPLLPFSHQYGISLVLAWWLSGCSLLVTPYGRLDGALRTAAAAGATVVDATPSTYHTILNLGLRRPDLLADLSGVRMWCVGGAPLSPSLSDRFFAEVGQPLLDGYGSTEAGNIALATPDNPSGCGRPLDGVNVEIVDDDGKRVSAGKMGEVVVRSPALMEGYLPLADAGPPGEYRTNDLGYLDAEGNLYVVGRKFAVHRLGHTIYPEAVERRAAAAVGRPVAVVPLEDERLGCRLVFFVADPDRRESSHWRQAIATHLPAYEHPNHVMVVDHIPATHRGKPDVAGLRRLAADRIAGRTGAGTETGAGVRIGTETGAGTGAGNGTGTGAGTRAAREGPVTPSEERVRALGRVAEALRADPEPVVEILTEISVRRSVEEEVEAALVTLEGAVEEVLTYGPGRVERLAVFMPSNVLFYSYVLYLLVPSLFTEHITARPATTVAPQFRRLHDLLAPLHRLPIEAAVTSQRAFVDGPVAEAGVVVFTGAYSNAEQIRARLRDDQLFVFFGQGINPFIVGPGADLDRAVRDALRIRLLNSGQDCYGPDVLYVHDAVKDRFVDGLIRTLTRARYGNYRDPEADYGSLWYEKAVETSADYLHRNHEHIVLGGTIDFRTRRVEPAVLVREWAERVPIVEFFAPIFNVVGYSSPEQVRRHIDSPFFAERAMGAMIYDDEPGLLETLRRRHTVAVNETLLDVDNGNRPFGGYGVMANYVMRHGRRLTGPVLLSKTIAEHLTGPTGRSREGSS
ncbi:hypothetical protein GCM10017673_27940 [Streptosporangium violaceochromogenes]|nr:hypothetical protein GCM10017673_27940 [Streptosporangium violaceochromogenes]